MSILPIVDISCFISGGIRKCEYYENIYNNYKRIIVIFKATEIRKFRVKLPKLTLDLMLISTLYQPPYNTGSESYIEASQGFEPF